MLSRFLFYFVLVMSMFQLAEAAECSAVFTDGSQNNDSPGTLHSVGIKIDNDSSNSQINTVTEALAIHAAWLSAGSPASGLINDGVYNVSASGSSQVDRIDFLTFWNETIRNKIYRHCHQLNLTFSAKNLATMQVVHLF